MNKITRCWLFSIVLQLHVSLDLGQAEQAEKQAESCHGETLSLSCSEEYVIKVKKIELGETACYNWRTCCPKPSDCTAPPSELHKNFVLVRCNGRKSCIIRAVQEYIHCNGNSEFERITYNCVERITTTSLLPSSTSSTTVSSSASSNTTVGSMFTEKATQRSPNSDKPSLAVEDNTSYPGFIDARSGGEKETETTTSGGGDEGTTSTVIIIAMSLVVVVVVVVLVLLLVRRRIQVSKNQSTNGDVSVQFRHLENKSENAESTAAAAATEPLYELEMVEGSRNSNAPLILENIYSDPTESENVSDEPLYELEAGRTDRDPNLENVYSEPTESSENVYNEPGDEQQVGRVDDLYSEPVSCDNRLYCDMKPSKVSPSSELMGQHDVENSYDEVLFKTPGDDCDEQAQLYGNVDQRNGRKQSPYPQTAAAAGAGIYDEAMPWNESSYGAVGMRPEHPECEYIMPTGCSARVTSPAP